MKIVDNTRVNADPNDYPIQKIAGQNWVVIKTKSRCEKKAAAYCQGYGFPHYLPMKKSVRSYGARQFEFTLPLFPGYVFTQIALENKYQLDELWHTAALIIPPESLEQQLIQELNDLRLMLNAIDHGQLKSCPEIETGKLVKIKHGPLAGMNGIVTRRQDLIRITVNIAMISYSVSVDMNVNDVELDL